MLESLAILEHLGAGPLAAIVRQRLRERGVRGIPRGPRPSTRENPAGLTSREVQVLAHARPGHTNTELAHRACTFLRRPSITMSPPSWRNSKCAPRTEAVAAAFGLGIVNAAKGALRDHEEDGELHRPLSDPDHFSARSMVCPVFAR